MTQKRRRRQGTISLDFAWHGVIGAADRTAHGNQRRHHPEVSATLCSLIFDDIIPVLCHLIHSKTAGIFKRVGQYSLDPLILLRPLFAWLCERNGKQLPKFFVIFLWTQYQSLCLKHCFQSFLHLFTGEFSAIVNAVQIAGDVKEHRGRPPCVIYRR